MMCASCKREWTPTAADAGFITCPDCRRPHVVSKRKKGTRYSWVRKNNAKHEPSAWDENNVRHLEGD